MAGLSVIIPIYNVENYLKQCIDSVIAQTYTDLEIILIDDGSTDNCGQICDEYASKDDRICVLHKRNGGLCAARNSGIDMASGDYVTFLDGDDWMETDIYEKMMALIRDYNADLVMCNFCRDINGHWEEAKYVNHAGVTNNKERIHRFQLSTLCNYYNEFSKCVTPFCWNKIFNREFLLKHHLYFEDVKVYDDIIHSFSVFQYAQCVAYIPDTGYCLC